MLKGIDARISPDLLRVLARMGHGDEIVIADVKFLQRYNWKYIVVDEGHRLKNFNCKLLRELRTIPTANKLLLTGAALVVADRAP